MDYNTQRLNEKLAHEESVDAEQDRQDMLEGQAMGELMSSFLNAMNDVTGRSKVIMVVSGKVKYQNFNQALDDAFYGDEDRDESLTMLQDLLRDAKKLTSTELADKFMDLRSSLAEEYAETYVEGLAEHLGKISRFEKDF